MIILDGAHNPQGAMVLADFVKQNLSGRKVICVFGILSDKCYQKPTSYIAPLCDEMIITRPHSPRALDPEILAREARRYTNNVITEDDSDKAMELAISKAASDDVVLCCGSLYLVGAARTYIRKRFGISPYGGE
jgi:dihydrofolate synthase/folylpolyglutamate synthase